MPSRVEWSEVKLIAAGLFNVWVDRRDLKWAERAWERLSQAGLTAWDSNVSYDRVLGRLLALAAIYHTFCHRLTAQGGYDLEEWIADLEFENAFRAGSVPDIEDWIYRQGHQQVRVALEESGPGSIEQLWFFVSGVRPIGSTEAEMQRWVAEALNEDDPLLFGVVNWLTIGMPELL